MWRFGLLGLLSYGLYFLALLLIVLLFLGKLMTTIWLWLLVIGLAVAIYVLVRWKRRA